MKLSLLNSIAVLSLALAPAAFADSTNDRIEAAVQKQFETAGYDVVSVKVQNYGDLLLKAINAAAVATNSGGTGRSALITVKLPGTDMNLKFECTAWIPLKQSKFTLGPCGDAELGKKDGSGGKVLPFGNSYSNF